MLRTGNQHIAWMGCATLAICQLGHAIGQSTVTVSTVEQGPVDEVLELSGSVTSERRAALSSRTTGLVQKVLVEEGSRVKAGDTLLELDPALATLAVERARATLQEASHQLGESRRLYEEGRKLAKTGGLPQTEADARAATLAAREAIAAQLEATLREQQEILNRHSLPAPFSGVISAKRTEAGEWIQTGTPVLDLVELDSVRFDVQAPQERFADLTEKTPVSVRLDSAPEKEFPAKVLAKVPVKDAASRTFLVRLKVDAPGETMAPGVSGRAQFTVPGNPEALRIPRDALVRRADGGVFAWVLEGSPEMPVVRRKRVVVEPGFGEYAEILEGLTAGEQVVVRGNEGLQDGQSVRILAKPTVATQ